MLKTCFGFQNAWYFLVSSWSKADMIYDTGPKETPYGYVRPWTFLPLLSFTDPPPTCLLRSLRLQFALTVLIALPVQAFYIHRIARLARSLLGPSLVALWALTAFATGFAASLLELVGDPSQAPILPVSTEALRDADYDMLPSSLHTADFAVVGLAALHRARRRRHLIRWGGHMLAPLVFAMCEFGDSLDESRCRCWSCEASLTT